MKEIYSKKTDGEKAVDWKEINYNSLATEEVLREYARAFQSEVNKKAALIVLESLSEEKKLMLKLKYGEEKQLVAISLALNVSMGQLVNWNRKIITKVSNFMSYRLTEEDVFSKKKIFGMTKLLTKSIEFFTLMSKKFEVRQDLLEEMERRKKNYERLLDRIERLEKEGEKNSFNAVVITKMKNPEQALNCIAGFCRLDISATSRYLRRFANSVKGCLE